MDGPYQLEAFGSTLGLRFHHFMIPEKGPLGRSRQNEKAEGREDPPFALRSPRRICHCREGADRHDRWVGRGLDRPTSKPSRRVLGRGFDDLAISDVEDAVRDGRNPSVVGDHDDGLLEISVQRLEQIQDFLAGLRVEFSRGLVREEQGRIVRQGNRDGDPLLLTAAHLVRPMARTVGEADEVEEFRFPRSIDFEQVLGQDLWHVYPPRSLRTRPMSIRATRRETRKDVTSIANGAAARSRSDTTGMIRNCGTRLSPEPEPKVMERYAERTPTPAPTTSPTSMIDDASPINRPAVCHPLAPRARMDANSTSLSRVAAKRMSPSPAVRMTTMHAISSSMNPKKARKSGTERSCSTSSSATRIPLAPRLRILSLAARQSSPARSWTRYRSGSMTRDP